MLNKIFGPKKPNNHSLDIVQARATSIPVGPGERQSRALKIIHAGGHAERYYMAVPAARIIEKNPSYVLARPEVFRRPWDSIVRPEEILIPGQKYYIVPCHTVKKLRCRIRKMSETDHMGFSFGSKSSLVGNVGNRSISGILVKPGPKVKARNRHVRFLVENTHQKCGMGMGSGSGSAYSDKKSGNAVGKGSRERLRKPQIMDEKRRRARNEYSWGPSLDAINE